VSLRGKLLLAQAPIVAGLILVAIVSALQGRHLAARSDAVLRDNFASVLAAQRMNESQEVVEAALVMHLLGRSEEARRIVAPELPRFEEQLRREEGNITEPGEAEVVHTLRAGFEAYRRIAAELLGESPGPRAQALYLERLKPLSETVNRGIERILELNQDAIVRKNAEVERQAASLRTLLTGVALAAILLGIAGSIPLTRRILQPLETLADAARRLGERDFEARARIQGKDEIARLAAEFDSMADQLQRYQRSTLGELLQAQLAAQSAIDSLPDPVLVFHLDGTLIAANDAASRSFGIRSGERSDDPLRAADPAVRSLVARVREHVLSGHGAFVPRGFEEAVRVTGPEGERFLLARGSPVYDQELGVSGATVLLQDVTRLRRFDELKTDLMATVAHELRTPLTSLHMAVHLCLEGAAGPLTEKQTDLLDAARADCVRLQAMVNDLLDVSRLEGGAVPIVPQPVDADDLLAAAEDLYRASAEAKGVNLLRETEAGPLRVAADPERAPLVLHNLIHNAIRHTPAGGRVALRARPAEKQVRFEVEDTGPGVPAELRAYVFEKFARGPGEKAGGAGLGLFIAREIVRGHGGEIGVEDAPGGGSLFWFTLPRAEPAAATG